jgi:zinc protease
VIGRIENLDAAAVADVVAFHDTYYRPDNATLIVTGDFEPRQLDAWVDKYFAPIAPAAAPLPPRETAEPAWTADRTITVKAPNVPLPAVATVWLAPPVTDADAPALQVAAALLVGGRVVAAQPALVYRQQIATQASFSTDLRAGPGLLIASAIAAGGGSRRPRAQRAARRGEAAGEPARPRARELDKVKTLLLTQAVQRPADAARPRRRDRRRGRARRQSGSASTPTSTTCAASAPPTCSGCCAATSPARTASRLDYVSEGRA